MSTTQGHYSGGPDNRGSGASVSDLTASPHFFSTSAVQRTCHNGSSNNERHQPIRSAFRSEIHPPGVCTRPISTSSRARALPTPTSRTIFIHNCAKIGAGRISSPPKLAPVTRAKFGSEAASLHPLDETCSQKSRKCRLRMTVAHKSK